MSRLRGHHHLRCSAGAVVAGLLLWAATLAAPGAAGAATAPCGLVAPSTASYAHVVVIMDENLTWSAWQQTTQAPYTHLLASGCRLETNAAGETHPSFPNYLALASGTFNTCLACSSGANNIFHQLDVAGRSWKSYEESMPHNCAPNTSTVPYYRNGHNPAFWFTDLGKPANGGDGSCATQDVPLDPNLWNDLAADRLPAFSWVTPDDCRNMHWRTECDAVTGSSKTYRIKIGDAYIQKVVTAIAATPSYKAGKTLVIVTWDESNEGSVLNKGNWGMDCSNPTVYNANVATCHVVTILVSARLPAGPASAFFSHYSLTRATEQTLGLALLGGASRVASAPIY